LKPSSTKLLNEGHELQQQLFLHPDLDKKMSSIGKGGSGPGGALELHPLRHQDIISYHLHALVMYFKERKPTI
jgi:hypothetical protein